MSSTKNIDTAQIQKDQIINTAQIQRDQIIESPTPNSAPAQFCNVVGETNIPECWEDYPVSDHELLSDHDDDDNMPSGGSAASASSASAADDNDHDKPSASSAGRWNTVQRLGKLRKMKATFNVDYFKNLVISRISTTEVDLGMVDYNGTQMLVVTLSFDNGEGGSVYGRFGVTTDLKITFFPRKVVLLETRYHPIKGLNEYKSVGGQIRFEVSYLGPFSKIVCDAILSGDFTDVLKCLVVFDTDKFSEKGHPIFSIRMDTDMIDQISSGIIYSNNNYRASGANGPPRLTTVAAVASSQIGAPAALTSSAPVAAPAPLPAWGRSDQNTTTLSLVESAEAKVEAAKTKVDAAEEQIEKLTSQLAKAKEFFTKAKKNLTEAKISLIGAKAAEEAMKAARNDDDETL